MKIVCMVETQEDLNVLRHFAKCRVHQAQSLNNLVLSSHNFLEALDSGHIAQGPGPVQAMVGIDVVMGQDGGPDQDGETPQVPGGFDASRDQFIGQALKDIIREMAGKLGGGQVGPPSDIRSN